MGGLGLVGFTPSAEAISFLNDRGPSAVLEAPEGHARLLWGREPSKIWEGENKSLQVNLVLQLENGGQELFHSSRLSKETPIEEFFVSGLREGDSVFMLLGPSGQVLDRLTVRTQYPKLQFVFGLVVLGTVLLVFLVAVIWRGEVEGRSSSS